MGKPLVRFREGQEIQPGYGRDLVAPSRKQVVTEKTNFFLQSRKAPVYSKVLYLRFTRRFEDNRKDSGVFDNYLHENANNIWLQKDIH